MNTNKFQLDRYYRLVEYYKNNPKEGFCELHHILPKCLGGNDDKENLLLVPTRAHFIMHLMLYRSYPESRSLAHAFAMMAVKTRSQHRKTTGRLYEMAKKARSKALIGVPRPEWVKEKLRKPKSNTENYKKPKSAEHAKNISNAIRGKKKTEEHIAKMILSQRRYQEQRTQEKLNRIEHYRNLFVESGLKRKDFYLKYNLNLNTGKRYLRGL
jgi:hypothetical protein